MADLRTTLGLDNSSFTETLAKSRDEAKRFQGDLDAIQAKAAASGTKTVDVQRKYAMAAQKGLVVGNAATQLAGFADPKIAMAVNSVASGFIGLKEVAASVGMSMFKLGGAAAIAAGAMFAVSKLWSTMQEAKAAQKLEASATKDAWDSRKQIVAAYDKVLVDGAKIIGEENAKRLRVDIRSNDRKTQRAAMDATRHLLGGVEQRPELLKNLRHAEIESMRDSRQKDIASADLEFSEASEKMRKQIADASELNKKILRRTFDALEVAHKNKVQTINKQWDEKDSQAKKSAMKEQLVKPTARAEADNMAQVGLYTSQFLRVGMNGDVQQRQLDALKNIERNTKPDTTTDPFR